jgi:DNA-binding XRE family transcriptional regulator
MVLSQNVKYLHIYPIMFVVINIFVYLCAVQQTFTMSRKTFGKVMPRPITQNLELMGEQIMLARKRRHLTMQDIADRATVTRLTVSKVEHGDPSVALGIYARVLYALNLENDIKLIAGDDTLGRDLQDAELKK